MWYHTWSRYLIPWGAEDYELVNSTLIRMERARTVVASASFVQRAAKTKPHLFLVLRNVILILNVRIQLYFLVLCSQLKYKCKLILRVKVKLKNLFFISFCLKKHCERGGWMAVDHFHFLSWPPDGAKHRFTCRVKLAPAVSKFRSGEKVQGH